MTAASMESCRFVVLRSPGGRLGSVLDMGNRLRRMRGRFHRIDTCGQVLSQPSTVSTMIPKVLDPELSGEPQAPAHAA